MDNSTLRQKALEGLDGLEAPQLPSWESLPQLDLYMDQVMVLMERYLALFSDGKDKLITPSMINNYVKLGLIPPPVKKKYSREHLARLMTGSSNHKLLMPLTLLTGSAVALACNLVSTLPGGSGVLPLSAITPVVGAPVIIYVIVNQKRIQYFN